MSAARLLGVLLPLVFLVAAAGIPLMLWWERRSPSSFTRGGDLAWWGLLSADEQEDVDTASLDLAEQAEIEARADAVDAAGLLAVENAARINVLHHP